MRNSKSMELACAFSGYRGALTTIADLSRHGLVREARVFAPTVRQAVRLIMDANMERAEARGHGNKARRREAKVRPVVDYATAVRLNRMHAEAEQQSEGRVHRNTRAQRHE